MIELVRGSVRRAAAANWMRAEGRRGFFSIGFIPWPSIEKYIDAGTAAIMWENDDPVAFVVWGEHKRGAKIYQLWVRMDARRHAFGRAIVEWFHARRQNKSTPTTCWCAADLDANLFWETIGFTFTSVRLGGRDRRRIHFKWTFADGPATHTVSASTLRPASKLFDPRTSSSTRLRVVTGE